MKSLKEYINENLHYDLSISELNIMNNIYILYII